MLFDLVAAKKASDNIPESIKVNFPEIIVAMQVCLNSASRFFGFVIIPGDNPSSFTGHAQGLNTVGLLIHGLCDYSNKFGETSQWIVVSDKKTKKQLMQNIQKISKPSVKSEAVEL